MHPYLRNALAVIAGLLCGSLVNMALILLGPNVIPPPADLDVTTMEGLREALPKFAPKHFLFPWLAHALGTLTGAWVAARLAATHKLSMALIVGIMFLVGGIANIRMLPSPTWFTVLDLGLAYLPMAWLGYRLAAGGRYA